MLTSFQIQQGWIRLKKILPVPLRLFWVFEPCRGGVFHRGAAWRCPGGGGRPAKSVVKKKRRPHRFFGEVVFGTTFFFTMTFSLNSPRPACDAMCSNNLGKGAEKQRIWAKKTADSPERLFGPPGLGGLNIKFEICAVTYDGN